MEVKDGRVAQGQTTQKSLRDHARKLFAEKGYSGANTDELVRRAKVTKGALYHHFTNKRDLYLGVVEDMERELVDHIEAAAAEAGEPWQRLHAMCKAYLDACRDPHLTRMLVLEAPVVLGWKTWCDLEQRYEVAAFARCLKQAEAVGFKQASAESTETLAQVILGALTTGARVIGTAANPEAARKNVEQTIERLLAGLRSNSAA